MLKIILIISIVVMFVAFKWLGDSQDAAYASCLAGGLHGEDTCRFYTY